MHLSILLALAMLAACSKDYGQLHRNHNVIILVIDGPRWSETWGDSTKQYIPHFNELSKKGTVCTQFTNDGITFTTPGHAAITTGVYENIDNFGNGYPSQPSVFQQFRKQKNLPDTAVYIIASKDKLHVLDDCSDPEWKGKYKPEIICGVNGPGTGYGEDEVTLSRAIDIMKKDRPRLMLVQFKEPDVAGHGGNWNNYLQEIKDTDQLLGQLWNAVEQNPYYKDYTTLIVTNDHGRHSEGWLDGFVSHGDNCDGCRHINFLAIGPRIKENHLCSAVHDLTDIAPTIAAILGFEWKQGSGSVMDEIMK